MYRTKFTGVVFIIASMIILAVFLWGVHVASLLTLQMLTLAIATAFFGLVAWVGLALAIKPIPQTLEEAESG